MDDPKCILCQVKNGKLPTNLLFEDKECFVILDIFPSTKGHMLVVSKKHYSNLLKTPNRLNTHMFEVAKRFSNKARKKLNATGIKIVINTGKDAFQFIDHYHIHIMPFYPRMRIRPREMNNKKITIREAERLVSLMSEVNNAHAFESRNLST
jgi:histidine triad (HIT) family protein